VLRVQISLTEADRALLDAEAARTGRSRSALIRDAINTVYGTARPAKVDLAVMRAAFGSWSGREESGAASVTTLRSGRRLTP
jgi:hypothetical protein